jgi:exodeoxyribonuclease-3
VETRRGLPGDPDDTHSRYIEAAIGGMIEQRASDAPMP